VITTGDAWKKKIEEYFKNDVDGRNITIIESLNPNYKKHSNIVGHVGKTLSFFPWKDQIVTTSVSCPSDSLRIVRYDQERHRTPRQGPRPTQREDENDHRHQGRHDL
jgi:hypothetical protein